MVGSFIQSGSSKKPLEFQTNKGKGSWVWVWVLRHLYNIERGRKALPTDGNLWELANYYWRLLLFFNFQYWKSIPFLDVILWLCQIFIWFLACICPLVKILLHFKQSDWVRAYVLLKFGLVTFSTKSTYSWFIKWDVFIYV